MHRIRSGDLRHRMEIQEKAMVPDGEGGFTETWTEKDTVWGKVEPVSAAESRDFQKVDMKVDHRLTMRGPVNLNHTDRIEFRGRVFEIRRGPRDINERGTKLELEVEEVI